MGMSTAAAVPGRLAELAVEQTSAWANVPRSWHLPDSGCLRNRTETSTYLELTAVLGGAPPAGLTYDETERDRRPPKDRCPWACRSCALLPTYQQLASASYTPDRRVLLAADIAALDEMPAWQADTAAQTAEFVHSVAAGTPLGLVDGERLIATVVDADLSLAWFLRDNLPTAVLPLDSRADIAAVEVAVALCVDDTDLTTAAQIAVGLSQLESRTATLTRV